MGAHLITHSLGGPAVLGFLNYVSGDWKSAHIQSFVPISPPFAGAVPMVVSDVGGDTLGVPIIPHDYLKPVQCSAPSGVYLLPTEVDGAFTDEPLAITDSKNYTTRDMPDFLADLGLDQALFSWKRLNSSGLRTAQLPPPGVPTLLLTSYGVDTPRTVQWKGTFARGYDQKPASTINGDGDGTVNVESLLWAKKAWASQPGGVQLVAVQGVTHFGMLSDPTVITTLKEHLSA